MFEKFNVCFLSTASVSLCHGSQNLERVWCVFLFASPWWNWTLLPRLLTGPQRTPVARSH